MRKSLVPKDFRVPLKTELGDYYLSPISVKNTIEDWLIIRKNADMIIKLREKAGGVRNNWPHHSSLLETFKDVAWLELCASYKQLFSYILRNKKDDSYAGCVYIYPIELFYPELAEKYDIDFSFWITKKEYDKGVYETIFKNLLDWLIKSWEFPRERIYLRNREIPKSLK